MKWIYSVDSSLKKPYDDKLVTLVSTEDFKDLIPPGLGVKLDYLRRVGNMAIHNPKGVSRDQAVLALQNLHSFLDFTAYCYGSITKRFRSIKRCWKPKRNRRLRLSRRRPRKNWISRLCWTKTSPNGKSSPKKRVAQLKQGYTVKPIDMTEAQTRKAYIDVMLQDAGWRRGPHWVDEYPIDEMPNKSGKGAADYVLFADNGMPLAVIEAKRTSVNVEKGRQQAVLVCRLPGEEIWATADTLYDQRLRNTYLER